MFRYSLHFLAILSLLAGCSMFDERNEAQIGYDFLKAGDAAHAALHLQTAKAAAPDDPYIQLDLAAAYDRLGRFADAKPLYEKVLTTGKDLHPIDAAPDDHRTLADIAQANLDKLPK
jgi:Tfp pilus assembly protein PilF